MDVDTSEFDLISCFRSMNTDDKDNLIAEFKRLSKTELSNDGCRFYLDLANWNLNTALWAYYEYDLPSDLQNLPSMRLVCDVTVGDGESIEPNSTFIKTWKIINNGTNQWPPGCNLKYVNGAHLSSKQDTLILDQLRPNEEADISIELVAPSEPGLYQTQFRLFTLTGTPFGDPIWNVINVAEGGILGITQQLHNVSPFRQQQQKEQHSQYEDMFS